MAHLKKYTKMTMGHMMAHYERSATHISNENLDSTRTHLNYNLACEQQPESPIDFIHGRLKEVRVLNRKDVNVFCDWVVTAPKDLESADYSQFFKSTYDFLENRYGKANVIGAWVHMDEVTPHMHFAFLPVCLDKKKGDFKLSAKEVITRNDLQTFHNDLQRTLEREMGKSVNVLNEATREGNVAVAELKKRGAKQRLDELAQEKEKIAREKKAVNQKFRQVQKANEQVNQSKEEVAAIMGKMERSLITKDPVFKGVSTAELKRMALQASQTAEMKLELEYTRNSVASLRTENEALQEQIRTLQGKLASKKKPMMEEFNFLSRELAKLKRMEHAFQQLPPEVQSQLLDASVSKSRNKELE